MKKTIQPGFALLSVFLLLTLATILVTQLYYKGTTYNSFVPTIVSREKAKLLARCGIPLAINQLALYDQTLTPQEKDSKKREQSNTPDERAKRLLKVLLTVQNRWQTFQFTEEREGIDGELSICITCEEGKIPLNKLIDFQKRQFIENKKRDFKGEEFFKLLFENFKVVINGQDLFGALLKFIKQQEYELLDVTDLFQIEAFKSFYNRVFYFPPQKDEVFSKKAYLTDTFTLWQEEPTINPFVLSHSVRILYGLNPEGLAKQLNQDLIEEIVKKINPSNLTWEKDWDTFLKPIYQKDYKSLSKEIRALLTLKFEPRVFSVLCYGKVGNRGQKLLAIIERTFTQQGEEFKVKKTYWL